MRVQEGCTIEVPKILLHAPTNCAGTYVVDEDESSDLMQILINSDGSAAVRIQPQVKF